MIDGLGYIKETLELNRDILMESKDDTNDLLVSDLLSELGYDRKRSNKVRKVRNKDYTWHITVESGDFFVVRVVELNGDLDISEDFVLNNPELDTDKFMCVIVTDGNKLNIYSIGIEKRIITSIDIFDESEVTDEVLTGISASGNIKELMAKFAKANVSEVITSSFEEKDLSIFSEEFLKKIGYIGVNDDNFKQKLFETISSVYTTEQTVVEQPIVEHSAETYDGEQEFKLRMQVSDLEMKLSATRIALNEAEIKLQAAADEIKELKHRPVETSNSDEIANLEKLIANQNMRITEKDVIIKGLESSIADFKSEIEAKEAKIKNLQAIVDNTTSGESNQEVKSREYRNQIEILYHEKSELEEKLAEKDRIIQELTDKVNNKVDPKITASIELLETIDDDVDIDRSYVGVVNGNLFQSDKLTKFIGLALQELYSCVSFELMPYLFDGDIFKITDKAVRKDMLLGNRIFDIDLTNISEDEAILRLKTLFSKFPAVVFFEKRIGTVREVPEEVIESFENTEDNFVEFESDENFGEESLNSDLEIIDENPDEQSEIFDEDIVVPEDDLGEDAGDFDDGIIEDIGETSGEMLDENTSFRDDTGVSEDDDDIDFGGPVESEDEIGETGDAVIIGNDDPFAGLGFDEDFTETPAEVSEKTQTLAFSIPNVGMALWSDECNLIKPLYVQYGGDVLKVRTDNLREQIQSLMYAMLLFADNFTETVTNMHQVNFRELSNIVSETRNGEDSIKIPYTKYFLNADNLGQSVVVLDKICEIGKVNSDDVYIYFEGTANVGSEFEAYYVDTSGFMFDARTEDDFNINDDPNTYNEKHCIISASVMNSIIMNKEQMEIQEMLIKKCIAIRTNYMSQQISSMQDVAYVITEMLANADEPDTLISRLGNVIGTDIRFISRNVEEVGENSVIAHMNGDDYYIADMKPWQIIYSLIHLHVLATGNKAISLRVVMDGDLYDYYNNEFTEFDPVKVAAVKSFMLYASERLK